MQLALAFFAALAWSAPPGVSFQICELYLSELISDGGGRIEDLFRQFKEEMLDEMLALAVQCNLFRDKAFDLLFERHRDTVLGWLRQMGASADEAEDVCSAVFLKLWRKMALQNRVFDPGRGSTFLVWLRAVVKHALEDYRRPRRAHPTYNLAQALEVLQPLDQHPGPAESAAANERADQLYAGIARLEPRDQEIVRDEMEGKPVAETAARLDMSIPAVYMRRHKVKKILRQYLGED